MEITLFEHITTIRDYGRSPTELHENPLTTTSDNLLENPSRRLKSTSRTYRIQLYKPDFLRKTLRDV